MGHFCSHAIIVTSFDKKYLTLAHVKANEIFNDEFRPSEMTPVVINGCCSFLIPPDGSKEGWEHSDIGDERRKQFKAWLRENENIVFVNWVEVQFADDSGIERIIDSGQKEPNEYS